MSDVPVDEEELAARLAADVQLASEGGGADAALADVADDGETDAALAAVDVSEADFDDPELLAELRAAGWDDGGTRAAEKPAAARAPAPAVVARPDPERAPSPPVSVAHQPNVADQAALVKQRIGQFKKAALLAKKGGEMDRARDMLRTAKAIENKYGEELSIGLDVDLSGLPPAPVLASAGGAATGAPGPAGGAAMPARAAVDESWTGVDVTEERQADNARVYSILGAALKRQLTWLAAQADDAMQKKSDDEQSLALHERRKFVVDELKRLGDWHGRGLDPPAYRFETETVVEKVVDEDVPDDELHVHIGEARGIMSSAASTYADVRLEYPKDNEQVSQTSTRGEQQPTYGHVARFRIDRNSRVCMKHIEVRKMHVEVWMKRFLRRALSLGHVAFKMTPLMTDCRMDFAARLLDERRKETGGVVDLSLRLRRPMKADKVVKREERIVVLDFSEERMHGRPLAEVEKEKEEEEEEEKEEVAEANVGEEKEEVAAKEEVQKEAARPAAVEVDEMDLDDPHRVDGMVSNKVMDAELEMLRALPQTDDVADRVSEVEVKQALLVLDVQTGRLTLDAYLDQVRARMDHQKRLAVALGKAERKADAFRVLKRIKVMQAEVSEAEEAMQGDDDEDDDEYTVGTEG